MHFLHYGTINELLKLIALRTDGELSPHININSAVVHILLPSSSPLHCVSYLLIITQSVWRHRHHRQVAPGAAMTETIAYYKEYRIRTHNAMQCNGTWRGTVIIRLVHLLWAARITGFYALRTSKCFNCFLLLCMLLDGNWMVEWQTKTTKPRVTTVVTKHKQTALCSKRRIHSVVQQAEAIVTAIGKARNIHSS